MKFTFTLIPSPAGKGDREERWMRRTKSALYKKQKRILFNKNRKFSTCRKFTFILPQANYHSSFALCAIIILAKQDYHSRQRRDYHSAAGDSFFPGISSTKYSPSFTPHFPPSTISGLSSATVIMTSSLHELTNFARKVG